MNTNTPRSSAESTPATNSLSPRTKRIIIGAAIVGASLLGVVLVYAAVVYPTKQPYRDAYAQYLNVKNANSVLTESGTKINAANASDDQFAQNIATVKDALQTLIRENDALAGAAVLNDGEGKAVYTAFTAKLEKYVEYNEAVIASIETLRPALRLCPNGTVTDDGVAIASGAARTCANALSKLELPNADYHAMAKSYSAIYQQLAEYVDAGNVDESQALIDELSTVIATFRKNLQTHQAEVDITEKAIRLDEYLNQKTRVF